MKGLVTGMSYQFRAWVRSETGLVNGSLAVSDTVGNNIAWTGVQSISNTWREFLVTFTATSQGIARIHLVKWDTTGALLWDDVELVNGATATSGLKMRYHPYGQEVGTATANDAAKFGTYTRDANSGLDYAMNRYYQSTWERFTSPDPYRASGGPADPGSWNRYSYVQGDPVNLMDAAGLQAQRPYPPGYCPAEYDTWECTTLGFFASGFMDGPGSGGGGGGGYDPCQAGPAFLPGPGCMLPVFVFSPPESKKYRTYFLVVKEHGGGNPSDCYRVPSNGGAVTREISYQLQFMESGMIKPMGYAAVVWEHLIGSRSSIPVSGEHSPSSGPPGWFDDTHSVVGGARVQVLQQTFTATINGASVGLPVMGAFGGDAQFLRIVKYPGYVSINGHIGGEINSRGRLIPGTYTPCN